MSNPDVSRLMAQLQTSGAFSALADVLIEASELIPKLDSELSQASDGADKVAKSNAFEAAEKLVDGLVDAITHVPSDDVAGALIHLVVANDFLSSAASWVGHTDTERGQIRLRQNTQAAVRCLTFALPVLLSLPQAKPARRLARRYVLPSLLKPERRAP